jgi:hypothetical protein
VVDAYKFGKFIGKMHYGGDVQFRTCIFSGEEQHMK